MHFYLQDAHLYESMKKMRYIFMEYEYTSIENMSIALKSLLSI